MAGVVKVLLALRRERLPPTRPGRRSTPSCRSTSSRCALSPSPCRGPRPRPAPRGGVVVRPVRHQRAHHRRGGARRAARPRPPERRPGGLWPLAGRSERAGAARYAALVVARRSSPTPTSARRCSPPRSALEVRGVLVGADARRARGPGRRLGCRSPPWPAPARVRVQRGQAPSGRHGRRVVRGATRCSARRSTRRSPRSSRTWAAATCAPIMWGDGDRPRPRRVVRARVVRVQVAQAALWRSVGVSRGR
jgi:hypothetical protein